MLPGLQNIHCPIFLSLRVTTNVTTHFGEWDSCFRALIYKILIVFAMENPIAAIAAGAQHQSQGVHPADVHLTKNI
jgi:hypothetical protein